VARLLPPESAAIDLVSREVGISLTTLERWRANALANGAAAGPQRAVTSGDRHSDDGWAARSAWCREHGLYLAELDAWKRDAIAGLGEPRAGQRCGSRQDHRRVMELERELHRKDKALADTATLLDYHKISAVFHQGKDE
jgi:transposase